MEQAGLDRLNALSQEDAVAELAQCCAARSWARVMASLRPYRSSAALFDTADRVWQQLGPSGWRDAFRGHPRIGEQKSTAPASETERRWSAQEQSVAQQSGALLRAELAEAQREYEHRFGHIFLICASGLSAAEILDAVRRRLGHDPATELRVAAEEQRKITRLRLEKLLTS